jgi:hypothetical protein
MPSAAGMLRSAYAQGTLRYFLHDRVLSGGEVVELCCSGGWLAGRFEWDGAAREGAPRFFFSIELGGGEVAEHSLLLPEGALLRWP